MTKKPSLKASESPAAAPTTPATKRTRKTPAPSAASAPSADFPTPAPAPSAEAPAKAPGIDEADVIQCIGAGMSLTAIAKRLGLARSVLSAWVDADGGRSARVREARARAASVWDEKAEAAILAAKSPLELAQAKELAHHYRWRASKIAPREYGDKLELSGSVEMTLAQRLKALDEKPVPAHAPLPTGV